MEQLFDRWSKGRGRRLRRLGVSRRHRREWIASNALRAAKHKAKEQPIGERVDSASKEHERRRLVALGFLVERQQLTQCQNELLESRAGLVGLSCKLVEVLVGVVESAEDGSCRLEHLSLLGGTAVVEALARTTEQRRHGLIRRQVLDRRHVNLGSTNDDRNGGGAHDRDASRELERVLLMSSVGAPQLLLCLSLLCLERME